METRFASRRAVVVILSLPFALPLGAGAATLGPPDDICRAQKHCRPLSAAELDRLRGGMSFMTPIGSIEITFGITQAVYINNKLVALTQLVGPGAGQTFGTLTPSPSQLQALNAALQGAPVTPLSSSTATGASPSTAAGPNTVPAQSTAPAAATAPVVSALQGPPPLTQTPGLNTTLNAAPNSAGAPVKTAAGSQSTASSSNAAATGPVAPTVLVNGSAVTTGGPVINVPSAGSLRTLIVQNGAGNVIVPSAADIRAATGAVIQNTLNDQSIRAVTQMNVSMALSQAINAASIRDAVRQGMATSRP